MPRLACRTCGRRVYTAPPIEALFAEERRCPRCGAFLNVDRRLDDRRATTRRATLPDDPGPPAETGERRTADRRVARRRRPTDGERDRGSGRGSGWID